MLSASLNKTFSSYICYVMCVCMYVYILILLIGFFLVFLMGVIYVCMLCMYFIDAYMYL